MIIGKFPQSSGMRFITTPDGQHRIPAVREDVELQPFTATKVDILNGKTAFTEKGITMGEYDVPAKISTPNLVSTVAAVINEEKKTLSPVDGFGDAATINVAAGKTFTSDNGIKQTGTLESPNLTMVTAKTDDIRNGKTAFTKTGLTTGILNPFDSINYLATTGSMNAEYKAVFSCDFVPKMFCMQLIRGFIGFYDLINKVGYCHNIDGKRLGYSLILTKTGSTTYAINVDGYGFTGDYELHVYG